MTTCGFTIFTQEMPLMLHKQETASVMSLVYIYCNLGLSGTVCGNKSVLKPSFYILESIKII